MRFYLYKELKPKAGVPWTRQHVRRQEKRGNFPMHVDLGENTVAWLADEVDAYVAQRIAARRIAGPALDDAAAPPPATALEPASPPPATPVAPAPARGRRGPAKGHGGRPRKAAHSEPGSAVPPLAASGS
jgi:hypothetical protein